MNYFENFFFGPFQNNGDPFQFDRNAASGLIFYRLLSLVINRFKYENMPETMDARFLELCLINSGRAGIADREGIRNFATIINGGFNCYGYPVSASLIDYMGRSYERIIPDLPGNEKISDGVIIYDNNIDIAPIKRIWWYSNRLYLIQTAISVSIQNTRAGVIWETNSRAQTRAIEKAIKALDAGKPYIITYGEENDLKDPPKITCNTQTPETLKILQETYDKTIADFLTEFGINANGVINKLSGIGAEELEQNEEATKISLNAAITKRREGLEKINKKYNTDIKIYPTFTERGTKDKIKEKEDNADDERRQNDI